MFQRNICCVIYEVVKIVRSGGTLHATTLKSYFAVVQLNVPERNE